MITAAEIQKAFHYLYPAELPALQGLARQLPENPVVVNIGSGAGTSGLAFLESRPDLYLVTIDIQDESSPFGCLEAERDVVERAGYGSTWQRRWWQIHADSKIVGKAWGKSETFVEYFGASWRLNKVHMVFIDGDHSYEGCKADIEAWMPNVRDGGILAIHDYRKGALEPDPNGPHPKPWPGVDSAVAELIAAEYEIVLHVDSLIAFRI